MRFALEHQNPLTTAIVTGGSAYPENVFAFLSISDPRVLLWALKPADDGAQAGTVVRLWNLGDAPVDCMLHCCRWHRQPNRPRILRRRSATRP